MSVTILFVFILVIIILRREERDSINKKGRSYYRRIEKRVEVLLRDKKIKFNKYDGDGQQGPLYQISWELKKSHLQSWVELIVSEQCHLHLSFRLAACVPKNKTAVVYEYLGLANAERLCANLVLKNGFVEIRSLLSYNHPDAFLREEFMQRIELCLHLCDVHFDGLMRVIYGHSRPADIVAGQYKKVLPEWN